MEYAKYGEHSHMQVHLRLKLSIDDKHVFYIWDFLVIFVCLVQTPLTPFTQKRSYQRWNFLVTMQIRNQGLAQFYLLVFRLPEFGPFPAHRVSHMNVIHFLVHLQSGSNPTACFLGCLLFQECAVFGGISRAGSALVNVRSFWEFIV